MIRKTACALLLLVAGTSVPAVEAQESAIRMGRLFGDAILCGRPRYDVANLFRPGELHALVSAVGFERAIRQGMPPDSVRATLRSTAKRALETGRPSRACSAVLGELDRLVPGMESLFTRFRAARDSAYEAHIAALGIDRAEPAAVATAVLSAFRDRDFFTLVALVEPTGRNDLLEILSQGVKNERYESITGEWRMHVVQEWAGEVGEVRYSGNEAHVEFGAISSDEVAVVTLNWHDGAWFFDDLHSPSRSDFAAESRTPTIRTERRR